MQFLTFTRVALALSIFLLAKFSVLPDIINILILWHWLEMEAEANSLLAVMRTRTLPEPQIVELYSKLKADIKHRAVPESAISPLFELIRLALDSPNCLDAGLSMLTHLIKRLQAQRQDFILDAHAQRLVPILIERLGSTTVRNRSRARQALVEIYGVSGTIATMIATLLVDNTFRSTNSRAQEEAFQWILTMTKDRGMPATTFIPAMLKYMESPDRHLSKAAKSCFIQTFSNASNPRKQHAQNALQNAGLDPKTITDIMSEISSLPNQGIQRSRPTNLSPQQPLGNRPTSSYNEIRLLSRSISQSTELPVVATAHRPHDNQDAVTRYPYVEPPYSVSARPASRSISQSTESSTRTVSHKPSESTNTSISQAQIEPLPFIPIKTKAETEAEKLDPIYVASVREIDNMFHEMLPHFEGAESEQNWKHREESVKKIRRVTRGNAYDDYPTAYLAGIKLILNGLIGVAESLRTTQCTLGCHCIEDIARRTGPNLDPLVEILLQSLVKLCSQTKKIGRETADASVICIISHVSFNVRLAQHIHSATQDKNVSPRSFACGWLMTVLTKHGHHKSVFEHHGALDLIYKSITAGLMDKDAGVRVAMRPTYWAFARLWNDKSESILLSLEKKQQQLLLKDASNPFPDTSAVAAALGEKAAVLSQSTSAVPARPSIKETIMARNRANRNLPAVRPSSAGPTISPTREVFSQATAKSATGGPPTRKPLNTSTSGNLSSAPVRPNRTFKRPELPRPATADPSNHRPKPDARSNTPAARRPKTPAPSTAKKGILALKKPISQPASPTKTVQRRISWSDDLPGGSLELGPSKQAIDDNAVEDDEDAKSVNVDCVPTHTAKEVAVPQQTSTASDVAAEADLDEDGRDIWFRLSMSPSAKGDYGQRDPMASPSKLPVRSTHHISNDESHDIASRRASRSPPMFSIPSEVHSPRRRPHLQVYEDPEAVPTSVSPTQSPIKPSVLSDLPINTPPLNPAHLLIAEETNNAEYHAKWTAFETSEKKLNGSASLSEAIRNPTIARRLLESAIKQIEAGTLEVHSLRRIQCIIRDQDKLWQDEYLLDELLLTLLEAIENPSNSSKQPQLLITIRQLLSKYPQQSSAHYPRALCAITMARAGHSSSQRIVSGLEATAETIVAQCEPTETLNAILDLLDADDLDLHSTFMGFYNLAGLLARKIHTGQLPLDLSTERRIGELVKRSLDSDNIDVRRGMVELAVQFHQCVRPEERFWGYLNGSSTDRRSLITYYVMRNDAVQA